MTNRGGRRSIFALVTNWAAVRRVKRELLEGVRRSRGVGRGVDVPLSDREDPERVPLMVRALEEILTEHPELQVLQGPRHLTLGYKADFTAAVAEKLRMQLETGGFIARPGEDLPTEAWEADKAQAAIDDLYSREEQMQMTEEQRERVNRGWRPAFRNGKLIDE